MKPSTSLKRFAIYTRCSSDDQAEGDFTTIDVQLALNRQYVQSAGGVVIAEISDEGKTGTNLERSGWRQVLALAESRAIDAVIVTYMSRLGRGDAFTIAEYLLKTKKTAVEMVQEKFTKDLAGRLQKRTKVYIDGVYADQVSEWTRTKQEQMVKMGYHCGGIRPFGYATETVPGMLPTPLSNGRIKPAPKRLIPHFEEAQVARDAFDTYLATGNQGDVQRLLRERSPEFESRGKMVKRQWSMSRVKAFLTDDVYAGVQRFGEHVNERAHEPLIDPATFAAIQNLLRGETLAPPADLARPNGWIAKTKKIETDLAFYLRGRVHCLVCGCRMTPASATGKLGKVGYYQCIRGTAGGADCPVMRVNARALHEAVLGEIVACASHPSRIERALTEARALLEIRQPQDDSEVKGVKRALKEVEKEIGRVIAAIRTSPSSGALLRELARLEEREASLRRRLSEATERRDALRLPRPDIKSLASLWGRLAENWEEATDAERSELFSFIVNRVEFQEKRKGSLRIRLHRAGFTQSDPGRFVERTQVGATTYSKRKRNVCFTVSGEDFPSHLLRSSLHSSPSARPRKRPRSCPHRLSSTVNARRTLSPMPQWIEREPRSAGKESRASRPRRRTASVVSRLLR